jgi:autotransporter-associated beta strand protein
MRITPAVSLLGAVGLTIGIGRVQAAQLIWDPSQNGSGIAASGNWDTSASNTVWFNGASDVLWSQTGTTTPTQGATFNGPDAAPGTYAVSLDAGQIAVTNLTINNNGFTFSGANAIYLGANDILSVAAGKTVTFNCNLAGSGTSPYWVLGSGATMNVGGNLNSGQQLRLAGPADSLFNLSGSASAPTITFILAPVITTNGTLTAGNNFFIGYPDPTTVNGIPYTAGSLIVGGSATVNENSGIFIMGRSFGGVGGQGTLLLQGNGAVNVGTSKAENLAICYDGNSANSAIVTVQGGTLTVGSSGFQTSRIALFDSTAALASETAILTQSGGTINAWGGIALGLAGGVGTAALTNSGGILYLGPNGITTGGSFTGPFGVVLSGGTVGALGNWSSSVPLTLGTAGSNITFQCADNFTADHNISLSGALTGAGGLYVTAGSSGTGTLTLSGANNYSGSTVVSNGTLAIVTGASPTNGPVTLDGSAGSPTVSVQSNPGQHWSIGTLTFASGTTTLSYQFGALSPSTTVAPIQVSGGVAFTVTPSVNIAGAAIAVGTYPLITYTGAVSGTAPTIATVTLSSGSALGYVTNIFASKTLALVVTSSACNPALFWAVGNGAWDFAALNWDQFGHPTNYSDGNAVVFDDSASGPFPITISLNTIVTPFDVTANNSTNKNYIIAGTGSIAGSGSLTLSGSGTVTLATTNTYSGGMVINAGQLNINNGGTATATAIGTGPLTINTGATLDNTSGLDVTLQANISENWNGNFTYLGSSNNFNTGAGQITMGGSIFLTVSSNDFAVGGNIYDGGSNFQLFKTGNGALTLPGPNNFGGGLTLSSGLLNLGDPSAPGLGVFTIVSGAIDNISGAPLNLISPLSYVWGGSFSFLGTTDLFLSETVVIPNGLGNITLNVVSNTLTTIGDVMNNNARVIKTGAGTWELAGSSTSAQSLGLLVSAGQVILGKSAGQAITGGNNVGLTVQANALVLDENSFQIHSDTAIPIPVVLSGGTWDLNGWNENVDELSISAGGTLRNGATNGTSFPATPPCSAAPTVSSTLKLAEL